MLETKMALNHRGKEFYQSKCILDYVGTVPCSLSGGMFKFETQDSSTDQMVSQQRSSF